MWADGDFNTLLLEGRSLQKRLPQSTRRYTEPAITKVFTRLMIQGKVNAALRYLSNTSNGGIRQLNEIVDDNTGATVTELLRQKHTSRQALRHSCLLQGPIDNIPADIYDRNDGDAIKATALRTQGAGGPSGLDSVARRRLCCSFQNQSAEFCNALAALCRKLCSEYVDPRGIQALVACRLIPLDKYSGMRPIGIGETMRSILAKAVMAIVRDDIQCCVGSLQVCDGQEGCAEAEVHAMRTIFQAYDADCVLMVDATNAFNSLNRQAALDNARILCPTIAKMLMNNLYLVRRDARDATLKRSHIVNPAYGSIPNLRFLM